MYGKVLPDQGIRKSSGECGLKNRIALDANCFINAVTLGAHAHGAMRQILGAHEEGLIDLYVSLQTLHELGKKPDTALELAKGVERLPHYSIGTWDEQVGTWNDEAGTWADGKLDDDRQGLMEKLAKSGNDIRDRGALVDALRAQCNFFITSDGQLSKPGPASLLEASFPIRIRTPEQYVDQHLS